STRPDVDVPKLNKFVPVELRQVDARNEEDVRHYLNWALTGVMARAEDVSEAATLITERADGLFIFARFSVDRLAHLDPPRKATLDDVRAIPPGLDGVYVDYFSRLKEEMSGELYHRALSPVVVARTPLPVAALRSIVEETSFEEKVLQPCAR